MIKKMVISLIFAIIMAWGIGAARADDTTCLNALAGEIVEVVDSHTDPNDTLVIASDGLIEFFTKNIDACRDYLLNRTSDNNINIVTDELIIDIDWDYIATQVAASLTLAGKKRTMFVCENDRSIQAGIDTVLWATTAIAAVASFGTGAVAVQGAKTAVIQGTKNLIKIGTKKGVKAAIIEKTGKKLGTEALVATAKESAAKAATQALVSEQAAKAAALETAKKAVLDNALITTTKSQLKNAGTKRVTDAIVRQELQKQLAQGTGNRAAIQSAIRAIDNKAAASAASKAASKKVIADTAGIVIDEAAIASKALNQALTKFALSTPIAAAGAWGSIYSYLESELNPTVMNCTDTDPGEGCYTTCSEPLANPTDDLNTKVFKRTFGRNLCVDEDTYVLRVITPGLPTAGEIFVTTDTRWAAAQELIMKSVQNQGNCDWNEDDIDIYVGAPMYDPSTLEPTKNGLESLIIDAIRIDD